MKTKKILIAILLLFFAFSTQQVMHSQAFAAGNTYYIATTGNDVTGYGSASHPWKTFAKGISVLNPGDTLQVFEGIYYEQVIIYSNNSGTSQNEVIIESVPNQTAVIKYDTNQDQIIKIFGSHIKFRNFQVDGSSKNYTDSNQCILVRPPYSATKNQSDITLDQLTVHGCSGHGIDIGGTYYDSKTIDTNNISITNNEVYDSSLINIDGVKGTSGWSSGIKISRGANGVKISQNILRDNWGEGIAITRGNNIDVDNNKVFNNFSVNIYIDNSLNVNINNNFSYCTDGGSAILHSTNKASGIATAEEDQGDLPAWGNQMTNIKITNNIIYNCHKAFAFYGTDTGSGGMRNSIIAHNTFYMTDSETSMFYLRPQSENSIDIYNNIFRANPSNNLFIYYDGFIEGTHNFHHNYWVYEKGSPYSIKTGDGDIQNNLESVDFVSTPGFLPSNFSIGPYSLAINAGSNSPKEITTDYQNNIRDGRPDIGAFEYITQGDINDDGQVNLMDAIIALQVVAGMPTPMLKSAHTDIDDDGLIGVSEAIYILSMSFE